MPARGNFAMPPFQLDAATSELLIIDVQERFAAAIPSIAPDQPVGRALGILIAGARLLHVPTRFSEQYVKGLGPTLPHLLAAADPTAPRHEKLHFSCLDDPALGPALNQHPERTLVVAGIETHVCVLGTVADARAQGRSVIVAADAVASRNERNRDHALTAMRDLGALVLPVESILLRWQRCAGTGAFKAISALVR